MTEEQDRIIRKRITMLTFGVILLMLVFMVVLAVTGKIGTVLFPIGLSILLAVYWVVSDVLPVVWRRLFEGKTDSQKRAYYYYAAVDAIGFAGLIYFIINLTSMTGALVYAASIFLKRRFWDDFQGAGDETAEDVGSGSEAEESAVNPVIENVGSSPEADTSEKGEKTS